MHTYVMVIPISERVKKGDAKSIVTFLKTKGPLSEESAKSITEALEKGRKGATRKLASADA